MNRDDIILLRSLWFPKGFVSDENCTKSLKLWLIEGNYYINYTPTDFSLFCQSMDEIKRSLSLDAFRFISHAAQTVYELEKSNAYHTLTSWRMIQSYYAAYYSAHSVLRFFGQSFSHLEPGHVQHLKNRCNSESGYDPKLPSSYYLISLSPENQLLSFCQCKESHRDLWKSFSRLISSISVDVLSLRASEVRRQSLSKQFADLADALTERGSYPSGNWLSFMRNEVNYNSYSGAWFPFEKSTPIFSELIKRVRHWRNFKNDFIDPNSVKSDQERFFITCFMIFDLGISIALDFQHIGNKPGLRSKKFKHLVDLSAAA